MSDKYLLGIDLGTSGTKTVLFRRDGSVVASSTVEYPMDQPENGWAEQAPEDWWNAAVQTISAVLRKSGVNPGDIAALGISGQMHGLVMLDGAGEVLRPSIIWADQRTGAECREITEIIGAKRLIEITANPALTGFTAGKIRWVQKHEPGIYAKCRHILLPKDYLRYKLTGDFATEVSDASGMQLLDVPGRCWSDEVLEKLGIDKSYLGKVYESPEVTGHISAFAAKLTGLSETTLVVGGAGDNAAAAVGTGVVADGRAFTTIGTSGVVFAHTDTLAIDPRGRVHTFCCAVPGAWHVMGVMQSAGLSLKWFRDNFCTSEMETAELMGVDPYQLMDMEVAKAPIGAHRLFYLPYLMGERTPHLDPDCRGVFFGLSAMHTKLDLMRAVYEGVAYALNDSLSILDEMGVKPAQMLATGGGGRSEVWRQMLSDVFDCKVVTTNSKEGPALGVAILAGVGAGLYPSVREACDSMIKIGGEQLPIKENQPAYRKCYEQFVKLYPDMKNAFKRLSE
ncbi:MAG: xylulokinase [Clostridiales bacterium]|nr:xylulokinase [Clostridiales bacterium]